MTLLGKIRVEITVNQLLSVTDKGNCSQLYAQGKDLLYIPALVLLGVRDLCCMLIVLRNIKDSVSTWQLFKGSNDSKTLA